MIYSNVVTVLVVGLLLPAVTPSAPVTSYSDLSQLVLDKMPWEVTPEPCEVIQCKHGKQLCKNGGVCEVTRDCNFQCKCPDGFTGWFCEMEVSSVNENVTMNLNTVLSSSPLVSFSSSTTSTTKTVV